MQKNFSSNFGGDGFPVNATQEEKLGFLKKVSSQKRDNNSSTSSFNGAPKSVKEAKNREKKHYYFA